MPILHFLREVEKFDQGQQLGIGNESPVTEEVPASRLELCTIAVELLVSLVVMIYGHLVQLSKSSCDLVHQAQILHHMRPC